MKIIPRRYPYYLDDLMNGALQGVAPRVRMDRCGRLEVEKHPRRKRAFHQRILQESG